MLGRIAIFVYGVASYALFFGTFLYAIGYVANFATPTSLDGGVPGPLATALLVNLGAPSRAHVAGSRGSVSARTVSCLRAQRIRSASCRQRASSMCAGLRYTGMNMWPRRKAMTASFRNGSFVW